MLHWMIRYKVYHVPFWIGYHLLWLWVNIGNTDAAIDYLFHGHLPIKFYGYIVFQAAAAYFNLYVLIPRFLYKGSYTAYLLLFVLTIIACSALIVSGYYLNAYISDRSFAELFGLEPSRYLKLFGTAALPSTIGAMTLAMSVKLTKNWLSAEKKRLTLEKDNLETELKYLKAQINPHFLFNTINSIFVLIHKNPDLASESLASFSALLRYQLYECNDQEIALVKELKFLEDFIELETLRIDITHTELDFDIQFPPNSELKIAPFILLPFVENTFKHVSKGKIQCNFIRIKLQLISPKTLEMIIENSKTTEEGNASGIGLHNVQRRLNLLYPHRHQLSIDSKSVNFKVALKLEL